MLPNIAVPVLMASAALAAPHVTQLEDRSTGGKVQNSAIARFDNSNNKDGSGAGKDEYRMYYGNGSTGNGWPDKSKWVSFEDMFNNNKNAMFNSCSWMGVPNNSGPEVGAIYDGIQKIASETGVDHRFILAIIMQESTGCVRVHTTGGSNHRNPGLMQDHNGSGTCNDYGSVQNPCPSSTIEQMIREGTAGTKDGDGLAQCLNQANRSDVSAFYRGARCYNSGDIPDDLNSDGTRCYASDIANRLTGWVNANSKCNL
ncbi:hypothetical protein LEL_09872 [Akanthomyces lecanii RCEF 1005]|uniref:Glycoside hydrolase n=1 Tax=Akanthomyces lecanii RCEF 1005 TaxID=1081108 RepID=A0A168BFP8_CORDF|nr:hypothetical protein LEL_09872 [Akanthomyces lecanii RCEF 1005]